MVYTEYDRGMRRAASFAMFAVGSGVVSLPLLAAGNHDTPEKAAAAAIVPALIGAKLICPAISSLFNNKSLTYMLKQQWVRPIAAGVLFAGMAAGAQMEANREPHMHHYYSMSLRSEPVIKPDPN